MRKQKGTPKLGSAWVPPPCGMGVLTPLPHVLSCLIWSLKVKRYKCYQGDPPENITIESRLSRSLKVIRTDAYQSATYDFLSTFHSNHRRISYRFRGKRWFQSKIAKFSTPVYLAPPLKGRRSTVVSPGKLSLSCARLLAGRVTALWLRIYAVRYRSANMANSTFHPIRGRLMSNPCYSGLRRQTAEGIHAWWEVWLTVRRPRQRVLLPLCWSVTGRERSVTSGSTWQRYRRTDWRAETALTHSVAR